MATISPSDVPKEHRPTLFIDRCAWSGKLGAALDAALIPYVPHHRHFAHDTPDEVWLEAVRHNGWLVLTRDQKIRYRRNEIRALIDAKLMMFVLSQGGLTAEETGHIVCTAYPAIVKQAQAHTPPSLFSITRSGEVKKQKLLI